MFKANAKGQISIIQGEVAKYKQRLHECSIHYRTGLPKVQDKLEK
jgi:hypothetical protein